MDCGFDSTFIYFGVWFGELVKYDSMVLLCFIDYNVDYNIVFSFSLNIQFGFSY